MSFELVALANLKIGLVMSRGDLQYAGAEVAKST